MAPLLISSLAFCRRRGARRGGGAAHQGNAGLGAGVDHVVGLLQGEGHGLVHEDTLHAGLHRLDRQEGAALGVGGDGQDVQVLLLVHLQGVGVEGGDAVALTEHGQPLLVAVGAGHQVHLGAVPDGLGVGGHQPLLAGMVVVVELAVDVQPVGGGALGALQVVLGSPCRNPGCSRSRACPCRRARPSSPGPPRRRDTSPFPSSWAGRPAPHPGKARWPKPHPGSRPTS